MIEECGALLKALARFAHERHRSRGRSPPSQPAAARSCCSVVALDAGAVHRRPRVSIDRELDGVVSPGQLLARPASARQHSAGPALNDRPGLPEETAETASFHTLNGSSPAPRARRRALRRKPPATTPGGHVAAAPDHYHGADERRSAARLRGARPQSPGDRRRRWPGSCWSLASAIQLTGPHTKVDELTIDLIVANKRFPLDLIASVLNAIGSLAVAWTLAYLYRCARARNQDEVKPLRPDHRHRRRRAGRGHRRGLRDHRRHQGARVRDHGRPDLRRGQPSDRPPGACWRCSFSARRGRCCWRSAFVLVSLNAMRQGLLTRFMGYLGIFAGVLVLFQITQIPVVQGYWLAALAYLISGRWPTGLPPAWVTGRAEPWPPSSDACARGARRRGARRGRRPSPSPSPPGPGRRTAAPAPARPSASASAATSSQLWPPAAERSPLVAARCPLVARQRPFGDPHLPRQASGRRRVSAVSSNHE